MNADQYAEGYKKIEVSFGKDGALAWLTISLMQDAVDRACERACVKLEDVKAGKAHVEDQAMKASARESIQVWREIAGKVPELKADGYEKWLEKRGLL